MHSGLHRDYKAGVKYLPILCFKIPGYLQPKVIQIDLNMMLVVLSAPVLNMEVALLGGRNVRPYGLITN